MFAGALSLYLFFGLHNSGLEHNVALLKPEKLFKFCESKAAVTPPFMQQFLTNLYNKNLINNVTQPV